MVQVFCIRLPDKLTPQLYWKYLLCLPKELQAKNIRFKEWNDKLLHLGGLVLLVEALQKSGLAGDNLHRIQYNAFDRPFIEGDIDFNISHSGKYVLCAVGKNMKLGIDIEEIKIVEFQDFGDVMNNDQWQNISRSFLPLKEFFTYWTIKESIIKADGRGLSIPLDGITVENNVASISGNKWFLKELFIDTSYCAFIASNLPIDKIKFYDMDITSFPVVHTLRGWYTR